MQSAFESGSSTTFGNWLIRLRRGGIGAAAILAISLPAAMRSTPAAAAPQQASIAAPLESVTGDLDPNFDRGLAALSRGEIDLVATYRTSSEDPCMVLRRRDAASDGDDDASNIAMLVRLKHLDLWVLYVSTASGSTSPRSLHEPKVRMRWRASRGVIAIALDPKTLRPVEAAASAWYAHRPPASEASMMTSADRTENPFESRRFAARRTAR